MILVKTINDLIAELSKYEGFELEEPLVVGIGDHGKIEIDKEGLDQVESLKKKILEALDYIDSARNDFEVDLACAEDALEEAEEELKSN